MKKEKLKFDLSLSSLTKWTDESGELIYNTVVGSDMLSEWDFIEGNTYKKPINYNEINIQLQEGNSVTTTAGTVSFKQRDIDVTLLTQRDELKVDDLKQYWTAMKYQGKGALYDEYEFQTELMELYSLEIQKEIERQALSGSASITGEVEGLYEKALTETGSLGHYGTYSGGLTAGNVISKTDEAIEEYYDHCSNVAAKPSIMYLTYGDTRTLINQLITDYGDFLNREKDFLDGEHVRFQHPKAPNITVWGTHAARDGDIYLTDKANLKYSGDLVNDSDMAYTEVNTYHQRFLVLFKFFLGFNVAFPGNVVYINKV